MILVLVLAALMVAAYFKSKNRQTGEEVEISEVKKRDIKELVSASGKVFPEKEVIISSDVSGEIVALPIEEGDSVKAGQILARIDAEAYLSQVERGTAGLNTTKAQLAISKSNVNNNAAQLEQLQVQLDNAQRRHDRNKQLLEQGVISDVEFETTETEVATAKANIRATEASIVSAKERIRADEFSVKSAQASLKELQTSLKRTTIVAPVSGIVSKLDVEEGERVVGTIQMTGTEMMRIANLSIMEVQVDVSENDILKVSEGDTASIEVDAYLDRTFSGVVTEIANSATSVGSMTSLASDQVTNFVVKILMDPSSYSDLVSEHLPFPFRPGMSASVDINTRTVSDVIAVPILAVTTRDLNKDEDDGEEDIQEVVFVTVGDSLHVQKVTTGVQDDSYIHISQGLEVGEEIVTGPYATITRKLEDGDTYIKKEKSKRKDGSDEEDQ